MDLREMKQRKKKARRVFRALHYFREDNLQTHFQINQKMKTKKARIKRSPKPNTSMNKYNYFK